VKHRFLLDLNILFFAIKEANEKGEQDPTASDLLRLIGQNCHTIVVDKTLAEKYWARICEFQRKPHLQTRTSLFVANFMANSQKMVREDADPPDLPAGVRIRPKDEYV